MKRPTLQGQVSARRDDMKLIGTEQAAFGRFSHFHGGMFGQQVHHHAGVIGIKMLDQQERHSSRWGQCNQQPGHRLKPAGRRPQGDNRDALRWPPRRNRCRICNRWLRRIYWRGFRLDRALDGWLVCHETKPSTTNARQPHAYRGKSTLGLTAPHWMSARLMLPLLGPAADCVFLPRRGDASPQPAHQKYSAMPGTE